ncbi:MAG: alpha/beta hydrolase [Verrucomicrobiaceae bacterium]|nr:alpha/beta hydrolase [Verrucomicrobiaceae bacterium]
MLTSLLLILASLVVLLLLFQEKLIYHSRGYDAAFLRGVNARPLAFTTSQGKQVAWLAPQLRAPPEHVWLVFCGNGTVALDFEGYFGNSKLSGDQFVLFDYPSYGQCEGTPSPKTIGESIHALVPAVAANLGLTVDELRPKLRVFGHSLGCASALMAMEAYGIKNGVLVAPFTSMLAMGQKIVGWPMCNLLRHRFDNVAALERLKAVGGVHLHVFHGTADEVIPVAMGRELGERFPGLIQFEAVQGARHNDIIETDRRSILAAMDAMR